MAWAWKLRTSASFRPLTSATSPSTGRPYGCPSPSSARLATSVPTLEGSKARAASCSSQRCLARSKSFSSKRGRASTSERSSRARERCGRRTETEMTVASRSEETDAVAPIRSNSRAISNALNRPAPCSIISAVRAARPALPGGSWAEPRETTTRRPMRGSDRRSRNHTSGKPGGLRTVGAGGTKRSATDKVGREPISTPASRSLGAVCEGSEPHAQSPRTRPVTLQRGCAFFTPALSWARSARRHAAPDSATFAPLRRPRRRWRWSGGKGLCGARRALRARFDRR